MHPISAICAGWGLCPPLVQRIIRSAQIRSTRHQQMDTAAIRSAHSIPAAYLDAFERHLRAENKAPATITTYRKACDQLAAFLDARGMPPLANLRREHIEAFLVDLQERAAAPATVAQRYRSI